MAARSRGCSSAHGGKASRSAKRPISSSVPTSPSLTAAKTRAIGWSSHRRMRSTSVGPCGAVLRAEACASRRARAARQPVFVQPLLKNSLHVGLGFRRGGHRGNRAAAQVTHNHDRPMVHVHAVGKRSPGRPIAFRRIAVAPQEVVQDLDFDGMVIAGPIGDLGELLTSRFPVFVQRAAFRCASHYAGPYAPPRVARRCHWRASGILAGSCGRELP